MRNNEKELLSMLDKNVNAFDHHADDVIAPAMPQSNKLALGATAGNPNFTAQFDLQLRLLYFTEALGVYTSILPAALNAALQNRLPMFVFGNSDYAGGFKNAIGNFPLNGGWTYTGNAPFIYGKDVARSAFGNLDATAVANLEVGDLVLPITATVGGTNYVCLSVVRCQEVAYGKLLDAINSDVFWINTIRYVINDNTQLAQFDNTIKILTQSLFGLAKQNNISPNSNKVPHQFQNGIIDLPIKKGIDKNQLFGMYVNYTAVSLQWSIFVQQVDKLAA